MFNQKNIKTYTLSDGCSLIVESYMGSLKNVRFSGNVTKTVANGTRVERIRLDVSDRPVCPIILKATCFSGRNVFFARTYEVLLNPDGTITVISNGNDKAVPIQPIGSTVYLDQTATHAIGLD